MKAKLAAMAACLLVGGLASLAAAQVAPQTRCSTTAGVISCAISAPCHCISGSAVVSPTVTASWCRDRGAHPSC
jgi:hypothetical protein